MTGQVTGLVHRVDLLGEHGPLRIAEEGSKGPTAASPVAFRQGDGASQVAVMDVAVVSARGGRIPRTSAMAPTLSAAAHVSRRAVPAVSLSVRAVRSVTTAAAARK